METKTESSPVLEAAAEPDALSLGQIETFLQQAIEQLGPRLDDEPPGRAGAPRVLPALYLWAGLLVCVVRGFSSQLALWRLITVHGLWHFPRVKVSDQALYTRLAEADSTPMQQLFAGISALLAQRMSPFWERKLAPFAEEVLALDESTLDQMARGLPSLRQLPPGDRQLLGGKLSGLFDIRRQQWNKVQLSAETTHNEKVLARSMVAGLKRGTLLLADLGYFGFSWFDELTDQGLYWVSRLRAQTSFEVLHTFYQAGDTFDGLVWLGKYRADRAKHAVRLVTFRHQGVLYRYITNVRDPLLFPLEQIVQLYQRRWDFELAMKLVKRHLGLHLLWSSQPMVIELQLWATLIIAQIIHALHVESAARAGVELFEVSVQLLIEHLPQFARDGRDPLPAFIKAGRTAGFIRPSTRTVRDLPQIPPALLVPLPPGLPLERTPRYAQRKCIRSPALVPT